MAAMITGLPVEVALPMMIKADADKVKALVNNYLNKVAK